MVSTLRTMKTSITVAPNMPGVTLTDTASEAPEKSPSCGVEKLPEQAFRSITLNITANRPQVTQTTTEVDALAVSRTLVNTECAATAPPPARTRHRSPAVPID